MTDLMTDLIHILYVYIITYMYGFYVPGPENCSCTALINPPPHTLTVLCWTHSSLSSSPLDSPATTFVSPSNHLEENKVCKRTLHVAKGAIVTALAGMWMMDDGI